MKPKVKGLLDKIQVHSSMNYLTNYTSTTVHTSVDINAGINHQGISKDGSLAWTAGVNGRLSLGGVATDDTRVTKAHVNLYLTTTKQLKNGGTLYSGFFASRDIQTPSGAIVKGSVLDTFSHELSYKNPDTGLSYGIHNKYQKRNGYGESFYSSAQIKKHNAF